MMRGKTGTICIVVAVLTAVAVLWYTNRAVTPKTPTWNDVVWEAKVGGYRLLMTAELQELYEKSRTSLLLVDTRQEWEFRTGHISGAVNFPMEPTAWSRWQKRGELKKLLGPDRDRTVVFY
jgi:hypothetical protein